MCNVITLSNEVNNHSIIHQFLAYIQDLHIVQQHNHVT